MNVGESSVLEKIRRPSKGARHITLIDPAKQAPDVAAQRALEAPGFSLRFQALDLAASGFQRKNWMNGWWGSQFHGQC